MGYQSIESYPDEWFKQDENHSGEEYYRYMLVYVDGIRNLAHDPKQNMDAFNCTYRFNEEIAGSPKRYLGSIVKKVQMDNGKQCCSMNCEYNLQVAIKSVDNINVNDHGEYLTE